MAKKSCTIEVYFPDEDKLLFVSVPVLNFPRLSLLCSRREDAYTFESKREAKLFSKKLLSALKPCHSSIRIYIDDLPF